MDNTQRITKRAAFEQSLRRCGWDEGSITAEWYKMQELNYMWDVYKKRMDSESGFLLAGGFQHKLNKVV